MCIKRVSEYLFLWAVGGIVYYGLELKFRGFSHWSMFVLGGLCAAFIGFQGLSVQWNDPLWIQILRAAIFITSGEFITGILVNKFFHLYVWDYSDQPFQLWGQICLPFVILFSGLAAMGIYIVGYLLHWIYGEKKPKYHVL